MQSTKQKNNPYQNRPRKKLSFEANFVEQTDAILWEDMFDYLISINFFDDSRNNEKNTFNNL